METCNNGAIIGQGLKVDGNRYTSELRINVSDSLNNLTIHCLNAQQVTVGEASINVISDSGAFGEFIVNFVGGNMQQAHGLSNSLFVLS